MTPKGEEDAPTCGLTAARNRSSTTASKFVILPEVLTAPSLPSSISMLSKLSPKRAAESTVCFAGAFGSQRGSFKAPQLARF